MNKDKVSLEDIFETKTLRDPRFKGQKVLGLKAKYNNPVQLKIAIEQLLEAKEKEVAQKVVKELFYRHDHKEDGTPYVDSVDFEDWIKLEFNLTSKDNDNE